MADITVTAALVARVNAHYDEIHNFIAGVTITAGQLVYLNSAGKLALADGSAAGTAEAVGIALEGGGLGEAIAVMKQGKINGFTISASAVGALMYLSDTAGAMADAAGTVSKIVGVVVASADSTPVDQLYVDFQWTVAGV